MASKLMFLSSQGTEFSPLMMRTEDVPKTLVYSLFNHLTLLPTRGRFIEIQSPWKI